MKKTLLTFLFLFPLLLIAQPIELFRQFNGRLDFTAFGNTLNEFPNNGGNANCTPLDSSSATLALTSGQTFVSAHLYWGSVGTGDFDVALNGTAISAERTFNYTFAGNGLPYFAAYAEVTNLIAATGNGTYTFSDLDVSAIVGDYCGTDFAGWGVYVIYSDPSLRLNQISLFDGLDGVSASNTTLDITLTNIDVTSDILSKIGFLAWEGEESIANGESLVINGVLIDNPPLNPGNNAFNGTNSYSGSNVNYNMDLDFYDLAGIVQPGDTSVLINLSSLQDFVMVNNVITSVNSELSDATMTIDNLGVLCENNNIEIEYTVFNTNSTAPLERNTPIAFYADALLIGQTAVLADIPIGGTETETITLTLPVGLPNIFNLRAVIDDVGDGTGIIAETDETNNEDIELIDLSLAGILLDPGPACLGSNIILESGVTDPPFDIQWYEGAFPAEVAIPGATNATLTVTANGIYSVKTVDGLCRASSNEVIVEFNPQPVANPPVDLFQCDFGATAGVFDLTINDANILGTQDPTLFNIKYYETLLDSQNDTNVILGPNVHLIVPPSPQTIFVRIEDLTASCFDLEEFDIYFSRAISGLVPVILNVCDFDADGGEFVDLFVAFNSLVLDGEPSSNYNITYHTSQADADGDTNPLANPYFVTSPEETIFIRLENVDDDTCFDSSQNVRIIIDPLPVVNMTPDSLILCDANNDGFAVFDLSLATDDITLGDPTLTITYHGTLLDANNDILPLPLLYTNDQVYLDAPVIDVTDPLYGTGGVWARVSSSVSACFAAVPFTLEVRSAPNAVTPAEPLRVCDDAVADGFAFFDLSIVAPEVLGSLDPAQFDLYYFENNADAIAAGDVALTAPDFTQAIGAPASFLNTSNPQDIYILVVGNSTSILPPNPNSGEGCYTIVTLTLIVDPIPEDLGPFELFLCDDDLNGSTLDDEVSTFDLTTQNILVSGGDPSITVLWYETVADELANNFIVDPTIYQNINTPQTVVGRITSSFGCRNTITLTLTVLPNPNPNTTPTPLELCDDDDDGLVSGFDLTFADIDIIGGELDVSVLYYEDFTVATAGAPGTEITGLYTNTVPNSQIVFARVTRDVPPALLSCFTVIELELIVIPLPDMPDTSFADPFIGCDESGNGQAIFDLTLQDAAVLGSQDAADFLPISYYQTFIDATDQTNVINPATSFLSGGEPIFVRLESLVTGCVRITEFQIEVGLFPLIGMGDDLFACDDEVNGSTLTDGFSTFDLTVNTPLVDLGDTTLVIQYYASALDQINNISIVNPTAYQNTISPVQQIIVRATSVQGCDATSFFSITVEPLPIVGDPGSLIACDPNNDGFADFDLTLTIADITLSDPNLSVTFHGTYLDADNGVLPLPNIYTNEDIYNDIPVTDRSDPLFGTGGVWARVETTENSCHTVVPFALEVRFTPGATVPSPLRACDDAVADGFTVFDLTVAAPEVLGSLDPTQFDLYYYQDNADAIAAGDVALTAPDFSLSIATPAFYLNTSNPQEIYILVVGNSSSTIPPNPNTGAGCYDIVALTLIVDPIPDDLGPFEMQLCDDDLNGSTFTDEISTFDLTTQNILVNGGDPSIAVLWYETAADELANNFIVDPTMYQNTATPQTIVGRATSDLGCSNTVTLTLTVFPNPAPNFMPTPLELCDDDDDGLVSGFDLTLRDTEILDGQLATVLYYEDLADANAGVPGTEIVGLYTNIDPNSQTVYARVTLDVPPAFLPCYAIVELELVVIALPDAPDANFVDPFISCDETGDGQAIFDLTLQDAAVVGTQDPADFLPVSYHTTQADADAGTNAINPANAFPSIGQTIWVRLESLAVGCARVSSFDIEVGLFPLIGIGNDLFACDDEVNGSTLTDGLSTFDLTLNTPVIDLGDATLVVTYYASAVDQANSSAISNPDSYQNVDSPVQEIFVSVTSSQDCVATSTFLITVEPNPVVGTPDSLVVCDPDNDGFADFDLTLTLDEITLGDPTLIVTYHETYLNAFNGMGALPAIYTNVDIYNDIPVTDVSDPFFGTGGVWTRVETPSVSGCFAIVPFALEVRFAPVAIVPDPLRACDDAVTDGFTIFDLTAVAPEVLGGLDPAQFDLYYYQDNADAIAAGDVALTAPDFSLSIATPGAYLNTSNPQEIYILVVGNSSSTIPPNPNTGAGCYDIVALTLIVDPIPDDLGPFEMQLCDDDLNGSTFTDEISTFDLTTQDILVSGGDPSITVLWYETPADELANNFIVDPTMYQNTATPQTIVGRATSDFGCSNTVTLTLTVFPNPAPNFMPTPLELCDDDDDGLVSGFDLTLKDTEILNGELATVLYYEDLADANAGVPGTEIVGLYTNIDPNSQTVYARVTLDVPPAFLPCYAIVELELVVIALPDAPDANFVDPFTSCDETGDGQAIFDLTLQDAAVVGTQDPADFLPVSYHTTQADADAGANAINPANAFPSIGQAIWVRLESLNTGCARVSSFILEVGAFPLIGVGEDLYLCDDDLNDSTLDDGFSSFDLTSNTPLIDLGDTSLVVTYYANAIDQINGDFIINPTEYKNIETPQQEIFVSVFTTQGCDVGTTFFINVEPNPDVLDPTPLVLCDANNDGFGDFTLTDKDLEITAGVADLNVRYFETITDADNNIFALNSPYTNIVTDTQVIYARVSYDVPPFFVGCYEIVPLELQVIPAPVIPNDLPALVICDDNGFGVFDLTQQDDLVYGTQDPLDFSLSYHVTAVDAQDGANPIDNPEAYTNIVTPEQTIYVRLSDALGECFAVDEFKLQVTIGPAVNQVSPLTVCDELGAANDGIGVFDLTVKNDEITGGIAGVGVRYYETLLDAQDETNDNRINPDTAYVNTSNPQTIFVRVIDGNTGCFDSTSTLTIRVSPNPSPGIPEAIEACDDNDTGDGIELFDLTQRETVILNGGSGDLGYYEFLADAIVGDATTAIVTPTAYLNTGNPQLIYVRVTGDITNPDSCFEIVELELIVHPLPDDSGVASPLIVCKVGSDSTGVFDLTEKTIEILNGQDPSLFGVAFFRNEIDAASNENAIVNPTTFINETNPQVIYTGITQLDTGCYIGSVLDVVTNEYSISFMLEVLEGASATAPDAPYAICDNVGANDGLADFTLYNLPGDPDPDPMAAALVSEILGTQTTPPFELLFYETLLQAEVGDPSVSLGQVYTNTINPQIVYARVTNTDTNCYAFVEVVLKVEQLPLVTLDETYRLCVDINGNPIPEEGGFISPPLLETGLDSSLFDIVWDYPGGIAFGSSIEASEGGTYTVTYTEIATGCSATFDTTVTVSQPPETLDAVLINGAFANNDSIDAVATGLGVYEFQLDNGLFQDSGLFENVSPGVHTVTARDVNGCGSITIEVGVVDYPRYFTPNEDGFHDRWNIVGIAALDPAAKIYIFDRFGKLLKQLSPTAAGWNGNFKGNPLPSSDYWFLVEYKEEGVQREFKGHFTLKR